MTSPSVKVNTLFKQAEKPFIDGLSKFFIVLEGVLGLNRTPLIFNKWTRLVITLAVLHSFFLNVSLILLTYLYANFRLTISLSFVEYLFCIAISFMSRGRISRYYSELNIFDTEIGCRPKISAASIRNAVVMVLFTMGVAMFHVVCFICDYLPEIYITIVPLNLIHSLEMFYYGHLLSLLTPRLRLINYYVESALSTVHKDVERPKIEELELFKQKNSKNYDMSKLMDMYHISIKAYDFLVDAIKWQLLVVLVTSFGITLNFSYHVSLSIIRSENPFLDIVCDMAMTAGEMLPLFSPCMFGDRVHNEVRRLRELLASRLYENKLDKSGRCAARALLALTEARDLSFSLLRMLQIDISLPFKFIGLLVTYLIILLQFGKVINSSSHP